MTETPFSPVPPPQSDTQVNSAQNAKTTPQQNLQSGQAQYVNASPYAQATPQQNPQSRQPQYTQIPSYTQAASPQNPQSRQPQYAQIPSYAQTASPQNPQSGQPQPAQTPPYYSYSQPSPFPPMQPVPAATKPQKAKATPEQRRLTKLAWIAIALAFLLLLYCIFSDIFHYYQMDDATPTMQQSQQTLTVQYQEKPDSEQITKPDADGKYTVAGVAEAVAPSIVEIKAASGNTAMSSGSGIILSEDGYIVTNAHVLQDCDTFWVSIGKDKTILPATCIGMDTKTDLAVLKVEQTGLPAATIGDADSLLVGEEVVAIGNPAGLTGTVTNGIVSALHRQVKSGTTGFEMDCIQTNAAISPGNSGGALVNLYGQVVGITSSKYTSIYSGTAYEGLGFAISINAAMPIIEELVANGYVSGRVRIGITFRSLDIPEVLAEFQQTYNLSENIEMTGLWISEIAQDCDISNTELQVGDVIYSVNGTSVTNYDDLNAVLETCTANETLSADCYRFDDAGNQQTFSIKFQLMEDRSGNF